MFFILISHLINKWHFQLRSHLSQSTTLPWFSTLRIWHLLACSSRLEHRKLQLEAHISPPLFPEARRLIHCSCTPRPNQQCTSTAKLHLKKYLFGTCLQSVTPWQKAKTVTRVLVLQLCFLHMIVWASKQSENSNGHKSTWLQFFILDLIFHNGQLVWSSWQQHAHSHTCCMLSHKHTHTHRQWGDEKADISLLRHAEPCFSVCVIDREAVCFF